MLPTVNLNHNTVPEVCEIDDEVVDGSLAAKMEIACCAEFSQPDPRLNFLRR
jgi:hypothetical protein